MRFLVFTLFLLSILSLFSGVFADSGSEMIRYRQRVRDATTGEVVSSRRIRINELDCSGSGSCSSNVRALAVTSESRTQTYRDLLRIELATGATSSSFSSRRGFDVRVRYISINKLKDAESRGDDLDGDNVGATVDGFSFGMRTRALIEFNSTIAPYPVVSGPQANILQTYLIGSAGFKPISRSQPTAGAWDFTCETADSKVQMVLHLTETPYSNVNRTMTPSSIKLDFNINNWSWVGQPNSGAKLALRSFYRSAVRTAVAENENSNDENTKSIVISRDSSGTGSKFFWAPFATDGQGNSIPIVSTAVQPMASNDAAADPDVSSDSGSQWFKHFFIFDTQSTPSVIRWDPDIVISAGNSAFMKAAFSWVAIIASILASLMAISV